MKKVRITQILLFLTAFAIISCSGDDDSVDSTSCDNPTNFKLEEYNNASEVILSWDTDPSDDSTYEIEYGLTGFKQGDGVIVTAITSPATIKGLNFNAAYDFYLRRACTDATSEFVGPATNTPGGNNVSFALMTANIAGVQYNNMKPFLFGQTDATRVVTFSGTNENFLAIQGNSAFMDPTFENTKEINLFIPQSQWLPGTYLLTDTATSSGNAQSNVNIIYNDSSTPTTQAYEEEDGSITITKFDLQERVVEGTFEFRFKLYYVDSGTYSEILECKNGTFKYSLDASFFD
ncbi:MAG: fibronectin type III domain-containing protein [Flavobacteriaceae bacterium]|nr:fibronectin type III domain-containing protein [Flavobacteriaceae bacterium]